MAQVSVVIPAYEDADLFRRALRSALDQEEADVEVVVSDDSGSEAIAAEVAAAGPDPRVRYLRGPRTGVAADNWNAGLDKARAPLQVLLHQDEWFIDPRYLRRAADALARPGVVCAIGPARVTGVRRASRHHWVRPIGALPGAQALLPLVNWVGPTASVVFRGPERFDPAFVQLADVEFYGRLMRRGAVARLSGVCVGSLGHHGASITARIDPHARALAELDLMAEGVSPILPPLRRDLFKAALRARAALRRMGV